MKPLTKERLDKAIAKYVERQNWRNKKDDKTIKSDSSIYIKEDYKTKKILIENILFLESYREYVHITTIKKTYKTKERLLKFEAELKPYSFIRVHKSYLIPLNKITSFTSTLIEVGKKMIPVGRTYKKNLFEILKSK